MGAHWHLKLPLSFHINFQEGRLDPNEVKLPDELGDFFEEVSRKVNIDKSSLSGDRTMTSMGYMLREELWRELMPFVKEEWEIMALEGENYGNRRLQFWDDNLKGLSFRRDDLSSLMETLDDFSDNYWLRVEGVSEVVVNQGWPDSWRNENWRCSMTGLVMWTSGYKIEEEPRKRLDFEKIRTAAIERIGERSSYVGLLKVLGY